VNSKCDRNHLAARLPVDPLGSLQCSPDPVAGAGARDGWEEREGNGTRRKERKGRGGAGKYSIHTFSLASLQCHWLVECQRQTVTVAG